MNQQVQVTERAKIKITRSMVEIITTFAAYAGTNYFSKSLGFGETDPIWLVAVNLIFYTFSSFAVGTLLMAGAEYVTGTDSNELLAMVLAGAPHRLARRLTDLAATIAGSRRASDAETWSAHLLGHPDGRPLTWRQQVRAAFGFFVAAVRMRARDAAQQACRPLDWIVTTDTRISWLVVLATVVPAALLFRASGWSQVWDDLEQVGVVTGFATGAAYGWRRIRGVGPRMPPR